MSPPRRSSRSKTVTSCPARVSCWAAASPAGPDPTTATRRPVRLLGICGTTCPSVHPFSAIDHSTRLIATGPGWLVIDRTQAASHGAGHRAPVNSGKLFVACRRSLARSHSPRRTKSFHSGMRLPSGQPAPPEWQNGMPQSMHRAAWVCVPSRVAGSVSGA